jgi:uncharacterized repeat protein (TIGR01451 family)
VKKFVQSTLRLGAVATLIAAGSAHALTGGGATIHNAATLTFNGGQTVTSWVNVSVSTIGTTPTFTVDPGATVSASDTQVINYTITSNANGTDSYSISPNSIDTGVGAPASLTSSVAAITLGATFTSAPSTAVDVDTGTVYVPAGSQTNLSVTDTVILGGFAYTVEAVRPGTIATTAGDTTTPETPTEIDLTLASAGPVIGNGTIPAGEQIGEQGAFTVTLVAGIPTVVGVNGTHEVYIEGNTSALDTGGLVVPYDTSAQLSSITVESGNVTIVKSARNVTTGGSFATVGVTAQPGDTLEYRIEMTAISGTGDATGSILTDEIPGYTTYVAGTTTLDGAAVTDDAGAGNAAFPLASANGGLGVNSATGAADQVNGGVIADGETATVIFQVIVD